MSLWDNCHWKAPETPEIILSTLHFEHKFKGVSNSTSGEHRECSGN